jgi:hypothetical protein
MAPRGRNGPEDPRPCPPDCVLRQTAVSDTLRHPQSLGTREPRSRRRTRCPGAWAFVAEMDYEIQHTARRCSTTGREFAPGETYYSVLKAEGAEVNRYDYAADAWQGPPDDAVGWWKSQIPDRNAKKKHWAPNDVLLQFWDELEGQANKQDMRYVLTLLLIRRRVLRLEEERRDEQGNEVLAAYCPRRETNYEIPVVMPEPPRVEEIQQELAALLQ